MINSPIGTNYLTKMQLNQTGQVYGSKDFGAGTDNATQKLYRQENAETLSYMPEDIRNALIQSAQNNVFKTANNKGMSKQVEELRSQGIDVTLGQGAHKYLDIKDKNGNTYRIWDDNGDGAIRATDLNLNAKLVDFKNDIKNLAASENHATAPVANITAPAANITAPADTTKPLVADNEEKGIDDNEARAVLKLRLETLGYRGDELEKKLDELLEYAKYLNSQKEIFSLI